MSIRSCEMCQEDGTKMEEAFRLTLARLAGSGFVVFSAESTDGEAAGESSGNSQERRQIEFLLLGIWCHSFHFQSIQS